MDYRGQLIQDLREPKQLELFDDPQRDAVRNILIALIENEEKIHQMHEVMEKVLAGEPGYAAHPKRMKTVKKKGRNSKAAA